MLTNREIELLYHAKDSLRVKCKCGHTNTILDPRGFKICQWCKHYVFLTPQLEFEYRLKEKIYREKRNRK